MAYRRSITSRVNILRQRLHPSFTYILHDDDVKREPSTVGLYNSPLSNILQRGYHSRSVNSANSGLSALLQERRSMAFSPTSAVASSFYSYSSNAIGEGLGNTEFTRDIAEVLSESTISVATSQTPVMSEVAVAAADSYFPVAALQYVIDGVHNLTGFNWWLSIALTTLMIRGATVPLLIYQLKATSKLTLMRPHLEKIKQQMQDSAMDPKAVAEGKKQMSALFKEYGVTPFTPLMGLFVQAPVFMSFYFAINNMVEKVPSFKEGGAFWFTDLTTPDALYVLPVLTGLSFLITIECNMQEGLEGNPIASTMKTFSRIVAFVTVPLTMTFPKAIFCYWITSNTFSLVYGLIIKRPNIKKFLQIPEIPVAPTSTSPQPAFSPFPAFKPSVGETETVPEEPSPASAKVSDRRISSSSVLNQRIRTLEKQVKGRSKSKKT